MPHPHSHARVRRPLWAAATSAAVVAGAATAVVVGTAVASSFTLHVAKNVHVTNAPTMSFAVRPVNKHESVAVGPSGFPVYTFQGETTHHLICHKTSNQNTNCWAFWPPVSPSSSHVSKPSGIRGTLGTFFNHGTRQLTLNGQPLYYFAPDIGSGNKRQATGDELKTFGSIWHIVVAHVSGASGQNSSTTTMTTTTNATTTNTTTTYPAYP